MIASRDEHLDEALHRHDLFDGRLEVARDDLRERAGRRRGACSVQSPGSLGRVDLPLSSSPPTLGMNAPVELAAVRRGKSGDFCEAPSVAMNVDQSFFTIREPGTGEAGSPVCATFAWRCVEHVRHAAGVTSPMFPSMRLVAYSP